MRRSVLVGIAAVAALLLFGIYVLVELRGSTEDSLPEGSPRSPVTATAGSQSTSSAGERNVAAPDAGPVVAARKPDRWTPPARITSPSSVSPTVAPADAATEEYDPNDPIYGLQNGEPPSAYRVRVRQGKAYLAEGNYVGAYKVAQRTIDEDPTFLDAYTVAVPALCATGDLATAKEYLGRLTNELDRANAINDCADLGAKLEP